MGQKEIKKESVIPNVESYQLSNNKKQMKKAPLLHAK